MNEVKELLISWLVLGSGTQSRAELNEATIDEYAEAYERGDTMPPVDVFYDGRAYILADGFHRVEGSSRSGRKRISVVIHQGSDRDAILFSCGANDKHGLRRTNADKRRAVERLLTDKEWAQQSDRWIAEKCGVSHDFVNRMRKQLSSDDSSTPQPPRRGKDGKTRKQPAKKPKPRPDPETETEHDESDDSADDSDESDGGGDDWDESLALMDLDDALREAWCNWRGGNCEPFAVKLEAWAARAREESNGTRRAV